MIKEAIILAGGFGTRLKSVVEDLPKPMALINERPFLDYQLSFLDSWGINYVILSLGYKAKIIQNHFGDQFKGIKITYCIEEEPLGTGGALKKAMQYVDGPRVWALNGDTLFDVNLKRFFDSMRIRESDFCLALRFSLDSNRYGSVEVDRNSRIINFLEKAKDENDNFINGGLYGINKKYFESLDLPDKFSLEKDFLEKYIKIDKIHGFKCHSFFMDIGVPEDYELAQHEFKSLPY